MRVLPPSSSAFFPFSVPPGLQSQGTALGFDPLDLSCTVHIPPGPSLCLSFGLQQTVLSIPGPSLCPSFGLQQTLLSIFHTSSCSHPIPRHHQDSRVSQANLLMMPSHKSMDHRLNKKSLSHILVPKPPVIDNWKIYDLSSGTPWPYFCGTSCLVITQASLQ